MLELAEYISFKTIGEFSFIFWELVDLDNRTIFTFVIQLINPSKKFCNSSLRGNVSLVTSSSYMNVVSLESLIIPLYNDVSLVMLRQLWNAQSL